MTLIKTDRLILRHARRDDLMPLHAIMSDPDVLRYWSTLPHQTLNETEIWLASMIDGNEAGSPDFIIENDGALIGKIGMWRMPEIGFFLAKEYWGKGYALEAIRAVIAHVFADDFAIEVDHLFADVDPRNTSSLALLHRAGFFETGRAARSWCIGGKWSDSIYLRLDRP